MQMASAVFAVSHCDHVTTPSVAVLGAVVPMTPETYIQGSSNGLQQEYYTYTRTNVVYKSIEQRNDMPLYK